MVGEEMEKSGKSHLRWKEDISNYIRKIPKDSKVVPIVINQEIIYRKRILKCLFDQS